MAAGQVGSEVVKVLAGHFLRLCRVLHPQDWPRPLFPARKRLGPLVSTHSSGASLGSLPGVALSSGETSFG
jgi:hypothetical protein